MWALLTSKRYHMAKIEQQNYYQHLQRLKSVKPIYNSKRLQNNSILCNSKKKLLHKSYEKKIFERKNELLNKRILSIKSRVFNKNQHSRQQYSFDKSLQNKFILKAKDKQIKQQNNKMFNRIRNIQSSYQATPLLKENKNRQKVLSIMRKPLCKLKRQDSHKKRKKRKLQNQKKVNK